MSAPIPAAWILGGQPVARNRIVSRSKDRMATTVVWDCSAGSFNWFYDSEEIVHVLDGTARLTIDGVEQVIRPGSVVVFPSGSHALWQIDDHVRKLAVFRHSVPRPFSLAMRALNRLRRIWAGGGAVPSPALA